jgi:hypothetical protein
MLAEVVIVSSIVDGFGCIKTRISNVVRLLDVISSASYASCIATFSCAALLHMRSKLGPQDPFTGFDRSFRNRR